MAAVVNPDLDASQGIRDHVRYRWNPDIIVKNIDDVANLGRALELSIDLGKRLVRGITLAGLGFHDVIRFEQRAKASVANDRDVALVLLGNRYVARREREPRWYIKGSEHAWCGTTARAIHVVKVNAELLEHEHRGCFDLRKPVRANATEKKIIITNDLR